MCERTIIDIAWEMRSFIKTDVAVRSAGPAEIVARVIDCFEKDRPKELLRPIAVRLVKAAIAKHLAEQENWPAVTDCDRLEQAFAELEQNGIFCRQDYEDCLSAGHARMQVEMRAAVTKGRRPRGYCFYHSQDADSVLEVGRLYLAFGLGPANEEILKGLEETPDALASDSALFKRAGLAIGREIAATLRRHGLTVRWPESIAENIAVQLHWQRRRAADAEEQGELGDERKWAEYYLPSFCLADESESANQTPNALETLHDRTEHLDTAAEDLRAIEDSLHGQEVSIEYAEGTILLLGPGAIIDDLLAKDLLFEPDWLSKEDERVLHVGKHTEPGPHVAGHWDQEDDGMKTAELPLPYVDPVEDMHHCLNDSPTHLDALTALAEHMDWAADTLRAVKDAIAGHRASVWTKENAILVGGPAAVIDDLIGNGHLEAWPRTEEGEDATKDDTAAPAAHDWQDAGRYDADHHAPDGGHGGERKTAKLALPYVQPGADLRGCLEETEDLPQALATHASLMDDAARMLRYFQHALASRHVNIEANADCVLVSGPSAVIDDLIERGALEASEPASRRDPV